MARQPTRASLVVGLALFALGNPGCGSRQPGEADPPCLELRFDRPVREANVILIVSDTMRRDHAGIYGGTARTPTFDRFARENVYFDQAYTQAPWTKPSIATLFTSLYPSQHRLASHPDLRRRMRDGAGADSTLGEVDVLSDGFTTLAEVMRAAGYRTAAFVSNPWMAREFGFDQGFDLYEDSFARWDSGGGMVSQRGRNWVRSLPAEEKFFLYLHYIDSHQPYGRLDDDDLAGRLDELFADARPVAPRGVRLYDWLIEHPQHGFSAQTLDRLRSMGATRTFLEMTYARGVEEFDRSLDEFLADFSGHPAFERTLILITSDHGEAMWERGYGNHGLGLYDDEAAVPMAARLPGLVPRRARVECSVGLIDVLPSLCDYLALECPDAMYGRSFMPTRRHAAGAAYQVTEGVMLKPRNRTVRNRRYKLFWEPDGSRAGAGEYSLYDTSADPGERRNLIDSPEHRDIVERMRAGLATAVPEFTRPDEEFAPLDPELEERLRSLGYIQ